MLHSISNVLIGTNNRKQFTIKKKKHKSHTKFRFALSVRNYLTMLGHLRNLIVTLFNAQNKILWLSIDALVYVNESQEDQTKQKLEFLGNILNSWNVLWWIPWVRSNWSEISKTLDDMAKYSWMFAMLLEVLWTFLIAFHNVYIRSDDSIQLEIWSFHSPSKKAFFWCKCYLSKLWVVSE